MNALADFILRHRGLALALVVALTLFLGYKAAGVRFNGDFSTYLGEDELVRRFHRIGEVFGGNTTGMVLVAGRDVFSYETLNLVKRLTEAYEGLAGIAYVTSLTNVLDFKSTEWGLEVGRLIRDGVPEGSEALRELRSYVLSEEMYRGKLVSEDGTATLIVLRFAGDAVSNAAAQFKLIGRIEQITQDVASSSGRSGDVRMYTGGMPFLIHHMTRTILDNMRTLVPLIAFILLLVLFLAFRKPGGVLLPLLVVLITVLWTVGLMALFGLSIDMLSGIMPVILIAIGSADGIHLMKRYYERRRAGDRPNFAVRETFSEMGVPIVLTTVTTMAGFFSLAVSQFSVIRQFGLVTALGVFIALVVTLVFLPPVLSLSRENPLRASRERRSGGSNRLMEVLGAFVHRWRRGLVLAAVGIAILAGVALLGIRRNIDWALCLRKGSDAYDAEMLLREKFGGSLPIQILVEGDLKDPATLSVMRRLEKYLETLPYVSNVQSIADVIARMNEVMGGPYRVPQTREEVANLWFLIEDEEVTEQWVANGNTEALIQGRLRGMRTEEFGETARDVERFLRALPERMAVLDLREVPPQIRETLLDIRRREIADKILWDLRRRGLEVDGGRIEEGLRYALMDRAWLEGASLAAQGRVAAYLSSPESEVVFGSGGEVEAIAQALGERVRVQGEVSAGEIAPLVRSKVRGAEGEDVAFLSESLEQVIYASAGEVRVGSILGRLSGLLPRPLDGDRNLLRDLKGDLWEANDHRVALDWGVYERLAAGSDLPLAGQVRASFHHTGLVPIFDRMERELMPTQIETLLLAMIVVIVLLAFIHRSFIGGLIAVVPISLTILVNFAVMGVFKIDLDSWTAMIASIAIGLGIDTDIHFISRFKRELALGRDVLVEDRFAGALKRTLSTTGVSIVVNALSVGLGFLVLLLAAGQHVRRIGGLVALTILLSALFTLIVLPSILLWVKPQFLGRAAPGYIVKRKRSGGSISIAVA